MGSRDRRETRGGFSIDVTNALVIRIFPAAL
jgi:hypothetical protein